MTEGELQVVRAVGFVLAFAAALTFQRLLPHARLAGSWRVNGAFWAIDAVLIGLVCGACGCVVARWAEVHEVGLFHSVTATPWAAVLVTVVALDVVSYLWHRANHAIAFLWRFHQVHHSDPTFTVSTGLRFHPGELLLSLPLRLTAVVALGASPLGVVVFEVLFTIANLIEHGDIDLPDVLERRLSRVCVLPALHRLHHSRNTRELNTNFGTIFSVWDRAFGTYRVSSSSREVDTGLPGAPDLSSLPRALLLPFARRSR